MGERRAFEPRNTVGGLGGLFRGNAFIWIAIVVILILLFFAGVQKSTITGERFTDELV